jgi:enoyl-CoA hydratase/carnithine racemase
VSIVESEDRGAVRHIVLNRPEKRNAMNQELLRALGAELREAAAESSVHCVVLRGNGPVFSAGIDVNELGSTGQIGMLRPFRDVFLDCANLCEEMTKPVVCQIHRTCVGGALEIALGCDLPRSACPRSSSGSSPMSAARPACPPSWGSAARRS